MIAARWRDRLREWWASLAARLELSHVLVATIGLAFAAVFSVVAFRHYLVRSQIAVLSARGEQISRVMQGYFSGTLFAGEASTLVAVLESTLNARVFVVDGLGQVILESPGPSKLPVNPFPPPAVREVLNQGRRWQGVLQAGSLTLVGTGIPVYVHGAVVGGVFLEASLAAAQETLRGLTLLLLLGEVLAVLVAAVLAYALGQRITAPLVRLTKTSARLGEGDIGQRVVPEGPREIRELGYEFNRMADRIEQQMERLREEGRLRDELVAHVAHDLKTPLTSIRGFLEAVRDGVARGPARERAILVAWEETRRLERLVERLLRMERVHEGVEPFRLLAVDELVARVLERMQPLAQGRGVRLEAAGEAGLMLWGQEDAVTESLINLLDNAVRFSPAGGTVWVRHARDSAGGVRIAVDDQGPGVPDDLLPHLFERFVTGDRARAGGNGLGLAIVRDVMRIHRGSVEVENLSGGGARFVLQFPPPDSFSQPA